MDGILRILVNLFKFVDCDPSQSSSHLAISLVTLGYFHSIIPFWCFSPLENNNFQVSFNVKVILYIRKNDFKYTIATKLL